MHTTRLVVIATLLFTAAPLASAASTTDDTCSFSDTFAYRSGALPYAGTLDEQIAASMDNVYATSTSSQITYAFSIGAHPAVRIRATDGDAIREIYYVNTSKSSYQFNLDATPSTYAKMKQNLRKLMRDPFGPQLRLCK